MSAPPMTIQPAVPEYEPGGAVPPGYQVPRQTGQGMQLVTPEPFFTGPPVDMVPQVIRREDFPPGPEGDQMYAEALQTLMNQPARIVTGFDEAGNPIYSTVPGGVLPNGRTGSEQAAGNFQRSADIFNYHGGLNVQNRARIRPGEAQQALFGSQAAMANGGQGRPDLLLDDATTRNIVTGLGGQRATADVAAQVRQDLINQGIIPTDAVPGEPNFGGPGQVAEVVQVGDQEIINIGPNMWIDKAGNTYIRNDDGSFSPHPTIGVDQGLPPPGAAPPPAPGVDHSNAVPTPMIVPPPPDRSGAVPTPLEQNPDRSGAVPIGLPENPSPYQYTQEGDDVFLDVTGEDGATHRFTGDVVEAAYTLHGYNSFDEMVLDMGYAAAVAALFNFITPVQPSGPAATPPAPGADVPPAPAPAPPPPVNPNDGTTGQPGGKGPSFF